MSPQRFPILSLLSTSRGWRSQTSVPPLATLPGRSAISEGHCPKKSAQRVQIESPQELLPVRERPARVPQNPDAELPSDENLALFSNGAKFKFLEQIIYITVIPFFLEFVFLPLMWSCNPGFRTCTALSAPNPGVQASSEKPNK